MPPTDSRPIGLDLLELGEVELLAARLPPDLVLETPSGGDDLTVLIVPCVVEARYEGSGPDIVLCARLEQRGLASEVGNPPCEVAQGRTSLSSGRQDSGSLLEVDGPKLFESAPHERSFAAGIVYMWAEAVIRLIFTWVPDVPATYNLWPGLNDGRVGDIGAMWLTMTVVALFVFVVLGRFVWRGRGQVGTYRLWTILLIISAIVAPILGEIGTPIAI